MICVEHQTSHKLNFFLHVYVTLPVERKRIKNALAKFGLCEKPQTLINIMPLKAALPLIENLIPIKETAGSSFISNKMATRTLFHC